MAVLCGLIFVTFHLNGQDSSERPETVLRKYNTAVTMQPFQVVKRRMSLGVTRALNDKLAIRSEAFWGSMTSFHNVFLDDFFGSMRNYRYANSAMFELQGRWFLGDGTVGSGVFLAPFVQYSWVYAAAIDPNPGSIGGPFPAATGEDAFSNGFGTGFMFGIENTTYRNLLMDIHLGFGARYIESSGTENLDQFLFRETNPIIFRFGLSVGYAHMSKKVIPALDTFEFKKNPYLEKNALLFDPALIFMRGVGLTYMRAISRNYAVVTKASVISQVVDENYFDYLPYNYNHFKRWSGGVAIRHYFNNDLLIGPYMSMGYNYYHFEYDNGFFWDPISFRSIEFDDYMMEDHHELEAMIGLSGGNDIFFFDIGVRQGFRFSMDMFESQIGHNIFSPGVYTFVHTGLGIRF